MELEEKINISFPKRKTVTVSFNDSFVKIDPFISVNDRMDTIKTYIDALNKADDIVTGYVFAEYSLILSVLDKCTNINIEELLVDDAIESGLWNLVKQELKNYNSLLSDKETVLHMINNQQSSLVEITELMNEFMEEISVTSKFLKDGFSKVSDKIMEVLNHVDSANLDDLREAFLSFGEGLSKLEDKIPGILTSGEKEKEQKPKKPGRPKKTD